MRDANTSPSAVSPQDDGVAADDAPGPVASGPRFVAPPPIDDTRRWLTWADGLPASRSLGLICHEMRRGLVVTKMEVSPWPLNPNGSLFGGLTLAALDQTLGLVAITISTPAGIAATSTLTGHFLRPLRPPITVRGEVVRAGRVLIFAEGTVYDVEDVVCARASGTWSVTESARGVMR